MCCRPRDLSEVSAPRIYQLASSHFAKSVVVSGLSVATYDRSKAGFQNVFYFVSANF